MLQEDVLDRVFHALSDPGRRVMINRLVRGPASVGELAEPLDMSLSAVGQHLKVLESCGLVSTMKRGRVRTCQLEPTVLRRAEQWLGERRTEWERKLDRLGAHLEQHATSREKEKKP